jgi:hypothetical protein
MFFAITFLSVFSGGGGGLFSDLHARVQLIFSATNCHVMVFPQRAVCD